MKITPWEERRWNFSRSEDEDMRCMDAEIDDLRERVAELEVELAAVSEKLVPEGIALVPIEPTPEMLAKAAEAIRWYEPDVTSRAVHEAMLQAAK